MGGRPCSPVDQLVRWRLARFATGPPALHLGSAPSPQRLWAAADAEDAPLPQVVTTARPGPNGGGAVLDFAFPSRAAGSHRDAALVIGRLYRAPDPSAPCVVLLHGLGAQRPVFEERLARRELRRGRSALHVVLPGHGPRRLARLRSGDAFLCADPDATRRNLVQATVDAVDCVRWLRAGGVRHVGVLGFSLGGLVACLVATRTRLDRMVAVTPPADLAFTGTRVVVRRFRRNLGLDRVPARTAELQLRPVIPHFLVPRTAPADIGLVAATRDGVVGCRPVLELASSWGVGRTWVVPRGHMTAVAGFGRVGELLAFVQGVAVRPRWPLPLAPALGRGSSSVADAPLL